MIHARNTASSHENKIHDDAVAVAYGFQGGLVPGVTVYGYLASRAAALSIDWLTQGSMRVRFYSPFYDGDPVCIEVSDEGSAIEAFDSLGDRRASGSTNASGLAWTDFDEGPPFARRPMARWDLLTEGTPLTAIHDTLDLHDPAYLENHCFDAIAEPSEFYRKTAHPAVLLAMANEILIYNYQLGPWIHASSELTNFALAHHGDTVTVRGRIEERFERKGHEFVVLDLAMSVQERQLLRVRHTAIYKPFRSSKRGPEPESSRPLSQDQSS